MKKQLEILSRQIQQAQSLRAGLKAAEEDPDLLYWKCMFELPEVTQLDMMLADTGLMDEKTTYEQFKAACDTVAEEKLQELMAMVGYSREELAAIYDFTRSWAAENPDAPMVQQWQKTHPRLEIIAERGWEYDEPRP